LVTRLGGSRESGYNGTVIIYKEGSPSGSVLIPQVSHAWLAWQLSAHWGNRRFVRPSPQSEVLAAIMLHDVGWTEFDTDPGIDGNGRPITFDRMPVARQLELWRANVARSALHSRYCGLLVAAHFSRMAEQRAADLLERGETSDARATTSFRAEMERLQSGWREELKRDARYEKSLRGPGWQANRKLLVACDKVSVYACGSFPSPFTIEVMTATGDLETITFDEIDERVWRVRPWPLRGDKARLRCEGRRVPNPHFRSAAELRDALNNAPVERLTFVLVRPSVPKKKA
jgi:hypothetical protein